MNIKEMNDIWRLIGTYRKGDKRLGNESLLKAWYAAMKIYNADDVRNAVIEHFRTSSFFPDVSEITSKLPCATAKERDRFSDRIQTICETSPELVRWHERWCRKLSEKGIPTLSDALEQGMTFAQWSKIVDEADAWDYGP